MKINKLLVIYSFYIIATYMLVNSQKSKSKEKDDEEEEFPSCKKLMMVMAKKQIKAFAKCAKEHKNKYPNKVQFQKHFSCIIKCTMYDEGLVDKEYMLSNDSLQYFFNKNIPELYHEIGFTILGACVEDFAPILNPKNEECTEYGNFLKCLQEHVDQAITGTGC